MISTDLLQRYPLFRSLDEAVLPAVSMATEEITCAQSDVLFETNQPADALYLLLNGALELWIVSTDRNGNGNRHFYPSGEVRPGELAGISALVQPYLYTATAQITRPSTLLRINARVLRDLSANDPRVDSALMHLVAQATMQRLRDARAQILALRK